MQFPTCAEDSSPAAFCCVCKFPLRGYCESHIGSTHPADSEAFNHFYLPLSAQAQITTKPAWAKLRTKLLNLHSAYVDLRENLTLMEKCSVELGEVLREYRDPFPRFVDTLQPLSHRLQALRAAFLAELESATTATTEAAITGATFPAETLSALIQAYEENPDEMKVFTYEIVSTEESLKVVVKVRFAASLKSLQEWNTDCTLELDIRQAAIEQNDRIEALERQQAADLAENAPLQSAVFGLERLRMSEEESVQSLELIQTPAMSSANESYEMISCSDVEEMTLADAVPAAVQDPSEIDGEIMVKHVFGATYAVDYSPAFTVENIKYKLVPLCKFTVNQQILRFAGRTLQDQRTLRDYGVTKNAVLSLSQRPAAKDTHFYIRTDYGEVYWLPYSPGMTIAAVKQRICEEHSVPVEVQDLRFQKEELADECALRDYNITRGSNLLLSVSQRVFPIRAHLPNHSPVEVKCNFTSTVKDIKRRIWEATSLSEDFQQLSFRGKVLEDSKIMGLCGVSAGSEVVVAFQPVTLYVQIGTKVLQATCKYLNTFRELKQQLAKTTGHAEELIRLTYAESLLDESKTIGECNLRQGFTLRALVGFPDHNEVYVRTLTTGAVVTLEHREFETVESVKMQLAPLTNHPARAMSLVHAGRELPDNQTLHDCLVNKGTVIYLAS